MDSRRAFIKKAAMLSGAAGMAGMLPPSIARAFEINPDAGTTWRDAEHVVILMQENRSFDHCFGALRGVRGFNDPRAITLPNNNLVWLQENRKGETHVPFRLNMKDTKATWMGSLPHSWTDQVDARNGGRYDQWLTAKQAGHPEYRDMPLTLGYYNREDIPFYYALADAFTVCDQNFCSSLTGTTPNRLYLWTGKIREGAQSPARVRNSETDYDVEAAWTTFPERLEAHQVSWRVYQNEISVGVGLDGEQDAWLANFTDNPLEWFSQHQVRFLPAYMKYLPEKIKQLQQQVDADTAQLATLAADSATYTKLQQQLKRRREELETAQRHARQYTPEQFEKLSQREKNLHEKAFTTNVNDPHYHTLTTLTYNDGDTVREVKVPQGDVLHQFREDVKQGKLPMVSWLVAPENFSDHPTAPWYGAWYLSEALDILTQNPEVWKKTIFILCYDENDGYFDHVPPFVPPAPQGTQTGKVSAGIDIQTEYVSLADELKRKPAAEARESAIGLGYRVPLVIASPWSRGGAVCSQVFDHTSILQFLEKFVSHKTGRDIQETNISAWRRTVCGDLTSVFTPYQGEHISLPVPVKHDELVTSIHKTRFKQLPNAFHALSAVEIAQANQTPASSVLPRQEKGTRAARALPYELYVDAQLNPDQHFALQFEASRDVFGEQAAGAPFLVYTVPFSHRAYAVAAGDRLTDTWSRDQFPNGVYNVKAYGPNGFFRAFQGRFDHTPVRIVCSYERRGKKLTGNLILSLHNTGNKNIHITISDNAYGQSTQKLTLKANAKSAVSLDLRTSARWYDVSVRMVEDDTFVYRFAGRIETGEAGSSDPAMA